MADDRRLRLARELAAELDADAGDLADLASLLVVAMRRPDVLRSPYSGKPTLLLRRVHHTLERHDRDR